MQYKLKAGLIALGLTVTATATAGPAWEFTSAGNSFNNNNWIFADAFTVTSTVTATGLGYYADPVNGQVDANPVALYKCDTAGCMTTGTLLAKVTVDNTYALFDHFRYVTISAVTLDPGDYLVSGVSHGDNYTWNDAGFSTDPSIIYPLNATRWQLAGTTPDFLNYINAGEIERDGFHGPNVFLGKPTFTGGVPDAATWMLMITGFGLVGVTQRRRRDAVVVA